MSDYQIIEYKGQRVLTTAHLAESYGTDSKNLNDNFQNNFGRYKLEKHYFVLEGEELKTFKATTEISGNLKFAPILYLWTEKGSWMQAKSLNTDKAWEAHEILVDDYYRIKEMPQLSTPSYMLENPEDRALKWIVEYREKKNLETQNLMLEQRISEYEPKVSYVDQILQSKGTVTTTQVAKDYGLTAKELNDVLHEEKIQFKQNGQWLLYRKYADQGLTKSQTIDIFHKNGERSVKMNTRWTQKGRLFIHELLTKRNIHAYMDRENLSKAE